MNNKFNNMEQRDIEKLKLLSAQLDALFITIIADLFSYIAIRESVDLIYDKYSEGEPTKDMTDADIPTVISAFLSLISSSMLFEISGARYEDLYKQAMAGEIDYSITPNLQIYLGNMTNIIAKTYILLGAFAIYQKDISQPIIGV